MKPAVQKPILGTHYLFIISVCITGVLYAVFAWENNKTIISVGDARFRFEAKGSDLASYVQLSRGALRSKFLEMRLKANDSKSKFSFSIFSAFKGADHKFSFGQFGTRYDDKCSLGGDLVEFHQLINDEVCSQSIHQDTYVYKIGSPDVIVARCLVRTFQNCSMSFYNEIGPYKIKINVAILKNQPEDWLAIAGKVRAFIRNHMTHLSS